MNTKVSNFSEDNIILASKSPARKKILEDAHINFDIKTFEIDETEINNNQKLSCVEKVAKLASLKGSVVAKNNPNNLVLSCDTLFEMDNEIYGKPKNNKECLERLKKMSSKTGILYTGHFASYKGKSISKVIQSTLTFKNYDNDIVLSYLNTGEPLHVAGNFAIDGFGGPLIDKIEGDYHNIVGLSLSALYDIILEFDLKLQDFWI